MPASVPAASLTPCSSIHRRRREEFVRELRGGSLPETPPVTADGRAHEYALLDNPADGGRGNLEPGAVHEGGVLDGIHTRTHRCCYGVGAMCVRRDRQAQRVRLPDDHAKLLGGEL